MIDVQEINDLEELAGYRLLWNSWLAQSPRATFFNTWDWLDNYWRHFGQNQTLRVLVVRSAGSPIGILPLCIRTERIALRIAPRAHLSARRMGHLVRADRLATRPRPCSRPCSTFDIPAAIGT